MQVRALNKISAKNESDGCLLCYDAPCTKRCPRGLDPAKVIRSLRFENISGATEAARDNELCKTCKGKNCVKVCLRDKIDCPVEIPQLMEYVGNLKKETSKPKKVDLGITFCGVTCENPFFLSSSVVASNYDMVAKALSWALRALVKRDALVVREFLATHDGVLAALVKREVQNKLTTGLKNPHGKQIHNR